MHLSTDVRKGAVDKFSSFRFENYLQILKNILRKSDKPLQQVARWFGEMQANGYNFDGKSNFENNNCLKSKHVSGPLFDNMLRGTVA